MTWLQKAQISFPRKKVNVTKSYPQDHRYLVNTFQSEMEQNITKTVYYYYLKYQAFIRQIDIIYQNNLNNSVLNIQSFDELLKKISDDFSVNTAKVWESVMDKNNRTNLNSKLKKMGSAYSQHTSNPLFLQKNISLYSIINYITGPAININSAKNAFPGLIPLSSIIADLTTMTRPNQTSSSFTGARTNMLGEIYETGVVGVVANQIPNFLSILQTGSLQGKNTSKNIKKIKADGIISINGLTIQNINGEDVGVNPTTGETVKLEESELLNIENQNQYYTILKKYVNMGNYRSSLMGLNIKSWTSRSTGGTMGSFSPSANEINSRTGSRIGKFPERFKNADVFRAYNGYIVSKYLINAIGVYNGLMVTGYSFEPTYFWLQNLYNDGLLVAHNRKGYIATNHENKTEGKAYGVSPHLAILRQADRVK